MYATPPETCVLGAVTGVGFKSIAPILSSQSVFEVGTKSAFSLCFIDLLCHAVYAVSQKIAPVLNILLHVKMFADLSSFFYLDQGRCSCPGASCRV